MIRLFKVSMDPKAKELVGATLDSGYIGQGPQVDEFERALEKTWFPQKVERILTLNSCTSAIDLALELIGVGPGDAVVTTPQTCTATNSPIVKRGAIPVWADVDSRGLVTPSSVKAAADAVKGFRHVKAIMVVDWAGTPVNVKGIRRAVPGIPIIEDAAHRFGGPVAGDYVCWSFQAIKHLTTGDGGALLTPFNQYERAKLLRWYGLDRESSASFRCAQNIEEVGFKYHMNDIAASIGLANLPSAVQNLRMHQDNARYLAERLGVEFREDSHYWFFPLTLDRRDAFIEFAAKEGVEASQVHARNDKHAGFRFGDRRLSGVDWFDAHQVAIPCGWWLTKEDLDHIVAVVSSW